MGASGEPKRSKFGVKNDDEKRQVLTSVLKRSWLDLGSFLGPSWADLSLKIVLSPKAALVFKKNHIFEKIGCQQATWVDLGPILGRFGSPKGIQNEGRGGSEEELS